MVNNSAKANALACQIGVNIVELFVSLLLFFNTDFKLLVFREILD